MFLLPCVGWISHPGGDTCRRRTLDCFLSNRHPICLKFTLAFGNHLVGSCRDPMRLAMLDQFIRRGLGNMNFPSEAITFHSRGRIHGISKELKARLLTTKDAGCKWDCGVVKTKRKCKMRSVQFEFAFSSGKESIVKANMWYGKSMRTCHASRI